MTQSIWRDGAHDHGADPDHLAFTHPAEMIIL